jgi:DNA-binding MurR/RpiR family transcriptional regulator
MLQMRVAEALETGLAVMRPSEADVVRRILRDPGRVARESLREIAAWCDTSDATVVRACRAAGFDGFQDLKFRVLRELTAGTAAPADAPDAPSYAPDLAATLLACEPAVEAAARLLKPAARVALAGVGASSGIGLVLADVLLALGKQALAVGSDEALGFVLTPPASGLVLIAISHSGETAFVLRAVAEARAAGVPSIGVTNEPGSELARTATVVLPTRCVERPEGSFSIAPRLCQLAALDRLVAEMRRGRRR